MSSVTSLRANRRDESAEWQLRVDLAAAFRLAAEFGWHEAVANHFSLAVAADGKKFLMNPRWRHFARVKASELLLLDADDKETMSRPDAPDASAWCIHGHLHGALPQARCILHVSPAVCHGDRLAGRSRASSRSSRTPPATTSGSRSTWSSAASPTTRRKAGAWCACSATRSTRCSATTASSSMGDTVAEAFDDLYYLERACQTLVLAYSTGQKLKVLSPEIAEATARGWEDYKDAAFSHFDELKSDPRRQGSLVQGLIARGAARRLGPPGGASSSVRRRQRSLVRSVS